MQLNIFDNDAFSLTNLTKAINDTPYVPQRLAGLKLFSEEGISTTSVSIEKQGTTLALVPAGVRGQPASTNSRDKRSTFALNTIHLPQRDAIVADEVQNLRAFGTESEVETVQNLLGKRLAKMRRNLDATIEFQRMGALRGQILDSDGTTVLVDLWTQFGVAQIVVDMNLDVNTTKIRTEFVGVKRQLENELGNLPYTGVRVLCSAGFFDDFVEHDSVVKAYDRWQDGQFFREDQRGGFPFAGAIWEEYRGSVGGVDFVEDGAAYAVPEGVSDLFVTHFAPADYEETVNTIGLPYYAKQEPMRMGKGREVESQSNPISLCTRPRTIIKLTA
jgi:hypothetical protein